MKKYVLVTLTSIVFIISIVACNKGAQVVNTNTYNTSPTALLPLKPGNVWYYQDSTFDDTTGVLQSVVSDSAQVLNQTVSVSSNPYWVVTESDSGGCFGYGGYFTNIQDANGNYDILVLDNNYNQDFYWGTTQVNDVPLLSANSYFDTTISCSVTANDYGFTTTYQKNGYSCYLNIVQSIACNGTENDYYYVCPGVGLVRYEVWQTPNAASNTFYLQYSQTLTGYKLK